MAASSSTTPPALPFHPPSTEALPFRTHPETGADELAASNSLLDLDREIDSMLDLMQDELEEHGAVGEESKAAFEMFCEAFGAKVDRIARFLSVLEARTAYCRKEAGRLQARAKVAENKEKQTKALLLYHLESRELKKIEGLRYTISRRKNPQDSLRLDRDLPGLPTYLELVSLRLNGAVLDRVLALLPDELGDALRTGIREREPSVEAIRSELTGGGAVPGATLSREHHIRVS